MTTMTKSIKRISIPVLQIYQDADTQYILLIFESN